MKLTQADLATALGVSQPTISRWLAAGVDLQLQERQILAYRIRADLQGKLWSLPPAKWPAAIRQALDALDALEADDADAALPNRLGSPHDQS